MGYLHKEGFSSPELTAVYGKSAGGMAAAMFCNLWPDMVQAAVLQVGAIHRLTSGSGYKCGMLSMYNCKCTLCAILSHLYAFAYHIYHQK